MRREGAAALVSTLLLVASVGIAIGGSGQDTVTIAEPGRLALRSMIELADVVAVVEVTGGDVEHYEQAVYRSTVTTGLKGAQAKDTVYFGPFVGYGVGEKYLVALRRTGRKVGQPNAGGAIGFAPDASLYQVMSQGYGAMPVQYTCDIPGCTDGVLFAPEYVTMPDGLMVHASKCNCGASEKSWVSLSELLKVTQDPHAQTRVIPNASWVSIYFPEIDKLARHMKLQPLRSAVVPLGGLELRLWEAGISGMTGYVVSRVGDHWSAIAYSESPGQTAESKTAPSETEWPDVWADLERAGIATIRDTSEIPRCKMVLDGVSYVVEIATPGFYRTYMLDNPQSIRSKDGDRFLRALQIVEQAFGEEPSFDADRLPAGGMHDISFVSDEAPTRPVNPRIPEWTYAPGAAPSNWPVVQMTTGQAIDLGVMLRTPRCDELPKPARFMHLTGDVEVEVLVHPDGSVIASRVVSGGVMLEAPSRDAAFKWRFARSENPKELRRATLNIRYAQEWRPFPWIAE